MFERFTDRARRAVVLAQEEARLLNHDYIGTEHLLLGLIHEGEGIAARALTGLGISLEAVRSEVEEAIGRGEEPSPSHIPFTGRAKKVLELSLREALQMGHNYIGTEHILLGLIREGEGVAAKVLVELGARLDRVRQEVVQLLSGYAGGAPGEQPARLAEPPFAGIAGGVTAFLAQEAAELVRVVPLAREVVRGGGYRVVLISLEIWSGWLDLRLALLPVESPTAPPGPEVALDWRVADDVGTTYELCGLATSGASRLSIHQLGFQPAPPAEASTLTLTASDADGDRAVVEIELSAGR